jgi:nucleotide-binding universal stress UspA family protein
MFDTVVVATDGSRSAARAVEVAVDVAERFDAAVHALYVVDEGDLAGAPGDVRADLRRSLEDLADDAFAEVRESAGVPGRC